MNKRVLYVCACLLLTLSVLAAVQLRFARKDPSSKSGQPAGLPNTTSSASSSLTIPSIDLTTWKSFRNPEVGFEIRYPSDLHSSEIRDKAGAVIGYRFENEYVIPSSTLRSPLKVSVVMGTEPVDVQGYVGEPGTPASMKKRHLGGVVVLEAEPTAMEPAWTFLLNTKRGKPLSVSIEFNVEPDVSEVNLLPVVKQIINELSFSA